jgi:hypothetical protein
MKEGKYLHAPIGGKTHLLEKVRMKGHLSGQLVVEPQQKVDKPEHFFLLALGEFSLEGQEQGVQEEPFHPSEEFPFPDSGIVSLREIVIEDHHGIKEALQLKSSECANIGVHEPHGFRPEGDGNPEAQEHVLAFSRCVDVEPGLIQSSVNASESGAVIPLNQMISDIVFSDQLFQNQGFLLRGAVQAEYDTREIPDLGKLFQNVFEDGKIGRLRELAGKQRHNKDRLLPFAVEPKLASEVLEILSEDMKCGDAGAILRKISHSGASDRVGLGSAM